MLLFNELPKRDNDRLIKLKEREKREAIHDQLGRLNQLLELRRQPAKVRLALNMRQDLRVATWVYNNRRQREIPCALDVRELYRREA